MYLLILSTIPHFYSIIPVIKYYKIYTFMYINIISLSTIFSILYHIYKESNFTINFLDYFFAGLWFIYDIYMGYSYTNKKTIFKILLVNMLSFFINIQIPHNKYYKLTHSIWHCIDKTKRFLEVLSTAVGIPTSELIIVGSGSKYENDTKNLTWAHPQVAINIAQWISPEFDVLVSKWVYEIMLTGKVDIRDNKTTQELDQMNVENKLLKNRIKLLESKVLQKQPRDIFDENKNVVYIVTTEYKEAQGYYKIGKTQDLQKRLSTLNTSDKHEVIYSTSCKTKKKMDLLEQIVHDKLEDKRIEPNKEWFKSEDDGEDFIKVIEEYKQIVNK